MNGDYAMLSKSKVLSCQQCPRKLWLELNKPEMAEVSSTDRSSIEFGLQIGDIARRLYDPRKTGSTVRRGSLDAALASTRTLLSSGKPIFEAGFSVKGVVAFADILLFRRRKDKTGWRMVEVKSSTSIKQHFYDDVALQAFVIRSSGLPLTSTAIAHIDGNWVYPGNEDYRGILVEVDVTDEALKRAADIRKLINKASRISVQTSEPPERVGSHCDVPVRCGFIEHCSSLEPCARYPIDWLPRIQSSALRDLIQQENLRDIRDVPDNLLNERQLRVKVHTLSGRAFLDAKGAISALSAHKLPAYFLDLETTQFAVPIWKGTRPYQQIPFQISVHKISRRCQLTHDAFLDLSGDDPSRAVAQTLIRLCGESGPVFVYNAGFETTRIKELGDRFPSLRRSLLAINSRIVDLLRIAEAHYYHPNQQGSWSIKRVLPSLVPDLRYDNLEGVSDGSMAMDAYLEAISPDTDQTRKAQIRGELLEYCKLDTYAMVRIWQVFSNRHDLLL